MKAIRLVILAAGVIVSSPGAAIAFSMEFDWGNIPACNSGSPNTVSNPKFTLTNVPAETKFIEFSMTDLDAPNFNHGGGTIAFNGQNTIEPGAFTYQSPCPPGGSHRYEWTAKAKKSDGFFSGSIASAKATRSYP